MENIPTSSFSMEEKTRALTSRQNWRAGTATAQMECVNAAELRAVSG